MNLLDYLIAFGGIYLIYASILMKVKEKIIKNVMVRPEVDLEKVRDKEGFIRYMWIRALAMGILAVFIGGVGILGPKMEAPILLAMVLGYLVLLIGLGVISARARKKFLD